MAKTREGLAYCGCDCEECSIYRAMVYGEELRPETIQSWQEHAKKYWRVESLDPKDINCRGYEVYPVNPRLKELEGTKCYPSLSEIPVKVDVVDFVVPPPVTEQILKECKKLGLERIWLQPGSESEAALTFCNENNLKVVHSMCVMMN